METWQEAHRRYVNHRLTEAESASRVKRSWGPLQRVKLAAWLFYLTLRFW